jgi:hypothetical protein
MSVLKGFGRGLLSFVAFLFLSLWLSAATLQMTLLNRDTVMGWLNNSGLYQNFIASLPTEISQEGGLQQSFITGDDLKAALGKTFTPSYIQQQTETALHATYDWIEGKQATIAFSIPVQQKQKELSQHLAKQIEPRIAKLPACATTLSPSTNGKPTCIPQGMTAASFAAQLTRFGDTGEGEFLSKPLTQKDLSNTQLPDMSWLPTVAANLRWLTIALPIGAIALATAYVFLSDSKLRGLAIIGRRFLVHGALVVAAGALLWYFGSSFSLSSAVQTDDAVQLSAVQNIADPLLKVVVPTLGQTLVLLGSLPLGLGAAAWITSIVLRKRLEAHPLHVNHSLPTPVAESVDKPTPPTILS